MPLRAQPPPVGNEHSFVVDSLVRRNVLRLLNPSGSWARALWARSLRGFRKYGVLLQPNNGRSAHQDAEEEVLDLLMYLEQMRLEGGGLRVRLLQGAAFLLLFFLSGSSLQSLEET